MAQAVDMRQCPVGVTFLATPECIFLGPQAVILHNMLV